MKLAKFSDFIEKKKKESENNNYKGLNTLEKHIALSASKHKEHSPYMEKLKERYTNRAYRSIDVSERKPSVYRYSTSLRKDKNNMSRSNEPPSERVPSRNGILKLPQINSNNKNMSRKNSYEKSNFSFLNEIEGHLNLNIRSKKIKTKQNQELPFSVRSKAGCNGGTIKINQDIQIIDQRLPFGLKLFCVCDGHGANGHHVSAFIKKKLLENLKCSLKTLSDPSYLVDELYLIFQKTNHELLQSSINTELSGSTVVAVFLHGEKIYCFNVGDSRAILINEEYGIWKDEALSKDQKPEREDEAKRIMKSGGRIDHQINEKGERVGPLRVWMKDVRSPGLAMTRSFGDKAGVKAGTNAQPQILEHYLHPKNKYILLASDGIWEHLQNHEVIKAISPLLSESKLQQASNLLMQKAVKTWDSLFNSRDDITFILIQLKVLNKNEQS